MDSSSVLRNSRLIHSHRPLKIGYYITDGVIDPHPACSRAVVDTVEMLKEMGHECVKVAKSNFHTSLLLHPN